ncbi:hypothetical protein [Fodinicurvata halophila]|uniref:hypothetical protein n=1 Tax=Fodinicurvata halophila TaxID=1419723 RepID=UPI00363F9C29
MYSSADVGVCELAREQAYRAALGVTLEERTAEMRRANERHKAFEVTFYEPTFRAVVLEGTCGPDGLEGRPSPPCGCRRSTSGPVPVVRTPNSPTRRIASAERSRRASR